MELAGPMWKKQSIKPLPVAHSRCFEQHWGLSRHSRYCFTVYSRDFAFLYKAATALLWLPFKITACLPLEGLTSKGSLRPGLSIRWLSAASSFRQYTMVLTCTSIKQSPAAGGILATARRMLPLLWSSWSEMDWHFQSPSACCSYLPGIKKCQ